MMDTADSPLAILFAEADARVNAPIASHTANAAAIYFRLAANPEQEPIARAGLVMMSERVCVDAREFINVLRSDPAQPGLEALYHFLLSELTTLATIYAFTDEHDTICQTIRSLIDASSMATAVWQMIRSGQAIALGKPPPRTRPRLPLVDDTEYYIN